MTLSATFLHSHESLILSKIDQAIQAGNAENESIARNCLDEYRSFTLSFSKQYTPKSMSASALTSLARVLDDYLNFCKAQEVANDPFLATRSKYYSSALEEVPVLLLRSLLPCLAWAGSRPPGVLRAGNQKCLIRIAADRRGRQHAEEKQIDFAFAIESPDFGGYVPLVGYEVKKYLDRTMFDTVLETYKALSFFRPRAVYGFIVEDEARSSDVIDNSLMYATEFVLTDSPRNRSRRNTIKPHKLGEFIQHFEGAMQRALDDLA